MLRAKFKSDQVAQARVELSFKNLQEWWFHSLSVLNSFVIYFNCLECTSFQFMTTASCPFFTHFCGECLFHKAPLGSKGLQLRPCFSLLFCWTSLQLLLVHQMLWTHNQRPTALVLDSHVSLWYCWDPNCTQYSRDSFESDNLMTITTLANGAQHMVSLHHPSRWDQGTDSQLAHPPVCWGVSVAAVPSGMIPSPKARVIHELTGYEDTTWGYIKKV